MASAKRGTKRKPGKLTAQQRRWVAEFRKEQRDRVVSVSAPGLEHLGTYQCRLGERSSHWRAKLDGLDLGTYFLAREAFMDGRSVLGFVLMASLVGRERGHLPIKPRRLPCE